MQVVACHGSEREIALNGPVRETDYARLRLDHVRSLVAVSRFATTTNIFNMQSAFWCVAAFFSFLWSFFERNLITKKN